jgi:hypothetical protein
LIFDLKEYMLELLVSLIFCPNQNGVDNIFCNGASNVWSSSKIRKTLDKEVPCSTLVSLGKKNVNLFLIVLSPKVVYLVLKHHPRP